MIPRLQNSSYAPYAAAVSIGLEQAAKLDENLPAYQPVSGLSGKLASIGSDTINNLMTDWAKGFSEALSESEMTTGGRYGVVTSA